MSKKNKTATAKWKWRDDYTETLCIKGWRLATIYVDHRIPSDSYHGFLEMPGMHRTAENRVEAKTPEALKFRLEHAARQWFDKHGIGENVRWPSTARVLDPHTKPRTIRLDD